MSPSPTLWHVQESSLLPASLELKSDGVRLPETSHQTYSPRQRDRRACLLSLKWMRLISLRSGAPCLLSGEKRRLDILQRQCPELAHCRRHAGRPARPLTGEHLPRVGVADPRRLRQSGTRQQSVRYRSKSRRAGHEARRLLRDPYLTRQPIGLHARGP